MKGTVGAQETIAIGTESVVDSVSPNDAFATVFEDDGDTGYFYALERIGSERPIVDAVQIYNVANVVDRAKPSEVTIIWSLDGSKSALFLNDYPHAVFFLPSERTAGRVSRLRAVSGQTQATSGANSSLQRRARSQSVFIMGSVLTATSFIAAKAMGMRRRF